MTYRAKHVTQKDGSSLQWTNCRMAALATHLDFHTQGKKTSTAKEMRSRQQDQSGGTDAYDAQRAWNTYSESLVIRNGKYWADLVRDREKGWFISLDVWYALIADRCQTSGNVGHTMGIAPETQSDGSWLVSDPLCYGYKWMKPATLRAAAEDWGKRLNIGKAIAYTTAVEAAEVVAMETINANHGVTSTRLARTRDNVPWYLNDECTEKGNSITARDLPYIGPTKRGTRAVLVNTRKPYDDDVARITVVYMKESDIASYVNAPPPPDCPEVPECPECPDQAETIAKRDAEWTHHLTPPSPSARMPTP